MEALAARLAACEAERDCIAADLQFALRELRYHVDEAHEAVGAPLSERHTNGGGGHLL